MKYVQDEQLENKNAHVVHADVISCDRSPSSTLAILLESQICTPNCCSLSKVLCFPSDLAPALNAVFLCGSNASTKSLGVTL